MKHKGPTPSHDLRSNQSLASLNDGIHNRQVSELITTTNNPNYLKHQLFKPNLKNKQSSLALIPKFKAGQNSSNGFKDSQLIQDLKQVKSFQHLLSKNDKLEKQKLITSEKLQSIDQSQLSQYASFMLQKTQGITTQNQKFLSPADSKQDSINDLDLQQTRQNQTMYQNLIKSQVTAEQFIDMIKHDPEMKEEFAFMNRFSDFYDYRAIEFKKRNTDHFLTISIKGVTENSFQNVTLYSIEEFYRDKRNYFQLKHISFFLQFNKYKNFNLWKKLCKQSVFQQKRKTLDDILLQNIPIIRQSVLSIRKINFEMEMDDRIISRNVEQPFELQEFMRNQQKFMLHTVKAVNQQQEKNVEDIIVEQCKQYLVYLGYNSSNNSHTQQAQNLKIIQKLVKFVKLIDLMFITTKLNIVVNTLQDLAQNMQESLNDFKEENIRSLSQDNQSEALSWIVLHLIAKQQQLVLEPSLGEVQLAFSNLFQELFIEYSRMHSQFLNKDNIIMLLSLDKNHLQNDNNALFNMITQDKGCELYFNNIVTSLSSLYSIVDKYGKSILNQLTEDYFTISTMENVDLEKKDSEDLTKYAQDLDSLILISNSLQDLHDIGPFLLNNSTLKKTILSCFYQKITQLLEIIPELTYSKAEQLHSKIHGLFQQVITTPTNVSEFVIFKQNVNSIDSQIDQLMVDISSISSFTMLIDQFKIKITDKHRQVFSQPRLIFNQLKKKIDDANMSYDSNMDRFKSMMEQQIIPQANNQFTDLLAKYQLVPIKDYQAEDMFVLNFLRTEREKLDTIVSKIKEIQYFQSQLELPIMSFEEVLHFEETYKADSEIWEVKHCYNEIMIEYKGLQVLEADLNKALNIVNGLIDKIKFHLVKNEDSPVGVQVVEDMNNFKRCLTVLSSLIELSTKDKKWEEYKQLVIDKDIFDADNLKSLKNENFKIEKLQLLLPIADDILHLLKIAQLEQRLSQSLDTIDTFWRSTQIIHEIISLDNNLPVYENTLNIDPENIIPRLFSVKLEVHKVEVQAIENSVIEQKAFKHKQMLDYIEELSIYWIETAQIIQNIQQFFQSPYCIKFMPRDYKSFQQTDQWYKKIIKSVKENPQVKKIADDYKNKQLMTQFKQNLTILKQLRSAITEYLNTRRNACPRLYLLSDHQLMKLYNYYNDIKAEDEHQKLAFQISCINNYIGEFFYSISSLQIVPQGIRAQGFFPEDCFELKHFQLKSTVDESISVFEDALIHNFQSSFRKCQLSYDSETEKKDWISKWNCTHILLLADQYLFCKIVEDYLEDQEEIKDWALSIIFTLHELIEIQNNESNQLTQYNVSQLIQQCVNQRDILRKLSGMMHFYWLQLPTYVYSDDQIWVSMFGKKINYGYEWRSPFKCEMITDSEMLSYYHYFNNDFAIYDQPIDLQSFANTLGKQYINSYSNSNSLVALLTYSFVKGSVLNLQYIQNLEPNSFLIITSLLNSVNTALTTQNYSIQFIDSSILINPLQMPFIAFYGSEFTPNMKKNCKTVLIQTPNIKFFIKSKLFQLNIQFDFKLDDLEEIIEKTFLKIQEIFQYLQDMGIMTTLGFINQFFSTLLLQDPKPCSTIGDIICYGLLNFMKSQLTSENYNIFSKAVGRLFKCKIASNPNDDNQYYEFKKNQLLDTLQRKKVVILLGSNFQGKQYLLNDVFQILNIEKILQIYPAIYQRESKYILPLLDFLQNYQALVIQGNIQMELLQTFIAIEQSLKIHIYNSPHLKQEWIESKSIVFHCSDIQNIAPSELGLITIVHIEKPLDDTLTMLIAYFSNLSNNQFEQPLIIACIRAIQLNTRKILQTMKKLFQTYSKFTEFQINVQIVKMFYSLLLQIETEKISKATQKDLEKLAIWSTCFILSQLIVEDSRSKLDKTISETIAIEQLPNGYSVLDCFIDTQKFEYYKSEELQGDVSLNQAFDILFIDNEAAFTLRYLFQLGKKSNQSIQLHGDVYSGKSVNLISLQRQNLSLKQLKFQYLSMKNEASGYQIIEEILKENLLVKNGNGWLYNNTEFQKHVVLIDDIHLADWEGDMMNMMSNGKYYNPWNQTYSEIQKILMVSTSNSWLQKSTNIPLRIQSKLIQNIYTQYIHQYLLAANHPDPLEQANNLIAATSKLFNIPNFIGIPFNAIIVKLAKEISNTYPEIFQDQNNIIRFWVLFIEQYIEGRLDNFKKTELLAQFKQEIYLSFKSEQVLDIFKSCSMPLKGYCLVSVNKKQQFDILPIQEAKSRILQINNTWPETNQVYLTDIFVFYLVKILRIIKQTQSHLILNGNDGVGKKSLLKLSSFILELNFNELNEQELKQNLPDLMNSTNTVLFVSTSKINPQQYQFIQHYLHSQPSYNHLKDTNNTIHLVLQTTKEVNQFHLFTHYPILYRICSIINLNYTLKEMLEGVADKFLRTNEINTFAKLNQLSQDKNEKISFLQKYQCDYNQLFYLIFDSVAHHNKYMIKFNRNDIQVQYNFQKYKHFLKKFKQLVTQKTSKLEKDIQNYKEFFSKLDHLQQRKIELNDEIASQEQNKVIVSNQISDIIQQIQNQKQKQSQIGNQLEKLEFQTNQKIDKVNELKSKFNPKQLKKMNSFMELEQEIDNEKAEKSDLELTKKELDAANLKLDEELKFKYQTQASFQLKLSQAQDLQQKIMEFNSAISTFLLKWQTDLNNTNLQYSCIFADSVVCAALITLIGNLTFKTKNQYFSIWNEYFDTIQLTYTKPFSISGFFDNQIDHNQIIALESLNTCFIYERNYSFLKEFPMSQYKVRQVKYEDLAIQIIKDTTSNGDVLLITNIESNHLTSLNDLISKKITKNVSQEFLTVQNQELPYNSNFKLILQGKFQSKVTHSVSSTLNIINCNKDDGNLVQYLYDQLNNNVQKDKKFSPLHSFQQKENSFIQKINSMNCEHTNEYEKNMQDLENMKMEYEHIKSIKDQPTEQINDNQMNFCRILVSIDTMFQTYYSTPLNFVKIFEKIQILIPRIQSLSDILAMIFQIFYLPHVPEEALNEFLTYVCLVILNFQNPIPDDMLKLIQDINLVGQVSYDETEMEMQIPTEIQNIFVQLASSNPNLEQPIIQLLESNLQCIKWAKTSPYLRENPYLPPMIYKQLTLHEQLLFVKLLNFQYYEKFQHEFQSNVFQKIDFKPFNSVNYSMDLLQYLQSYNDICCISNDLTICEQIEGVLVVKAQNIIQEISSQALKDISNISFGNSEFLLFKNQISVSEEGVKATIQFLKSQQRENPGDQNFKKKILIIDNSECLKYFINKYSMDYLIFQKIQIPSVQEEILIKKSDTYFEFVTKLLSQVIPIRNSNIPLAYFQKFSLPQDDLTKIQNVLKTNKIKSKRNTNQLILNVIFSSQTKTTSDLTLIQLLLDKYVNVFEKIMKNEFETLPLNELIDVLIFIDNQKYKSTSSSLKLKLNEVEWINFESTDFVQSISQILTNIDSQIEINKNLQALEKKPTLFCVQKSERQEWLIQKLIEKKLQENNKLLEVQKQIGQIINFQSEGVNHLIFQKFPLNFKLNTQYVPSLFSSLQQIHNKEQVVLNIFAIKELGKQLQNVIFIDPKVKKTNKTVYILNNINNGSSSIKIVGGSLKYCQFNQEGFLIDRSEEGEEELYVELQDVDGDDVAYMTVPIVDENEKVVSEFNVKIQKEDAEEMQLNNVHYQLIQE